MRTRDVVLEIVRSRAPGAPGDDDLPLGADGLGLDSIALAEVLLECETRLGGTASDLLTDGGPLTIARIVRHMETAVER